MIILGIDPGSHNTGYAFIQKSGTRIRVLEYGVIRAPKVRNEAGRKVNAELFHRIGHIRRELESLVKEYKPEAMVMESSFFAKNAKTAMILGHARGAIMTLCFDNDMQFKEFAPKEIKQAVTGSGSASKESLALMLQNILGLKDKPEPEDASDALGAAFAFVHYKV